MHRGRTGEIRRQPVRWALAGALGLAASGILAVPASAAPVDVTAGSLDWGFKGSFRTYVGTGNGNPPIAVSDGATRNSDGTFRFPATSGSYDASSGATSVNYGGTVVFSYPGHFFEITLANPTVVVEGGTGALLADVDLTASGGGFEPVHVEQAEIATLATAGTGTGPTVTDGTVTWTNLATTLTEVGASAFAAFYTAGSALDPLSFTFGTGTGNAPAGPAVTVEPASGVDPDGATLTVSGSGFDPAANGGAGIYVAFGPKNDADYWVNARRYKSVKWVHQNNSTPSGGQDKLNADGTFRTTVDVSATFTDGNGTEVDCTAVQCYVLTFAAHASPDRSKDTFTPITFGGSGGPGGPGGGTGADQEITAQVLASGPLTLTSSGDTATLTAALPGAVATGDLNAVTVNDLRGSNAGWNVVGQVEDFTSPLGGTIAAANLGWTPHATVVDDHLVGTAGQVSPGGSVTPGSGLGSARTLCSAAAGASAGAFHCGAALNLGVPAATAPGDYTATLTLTLS